MLPAGKYVAKAIDAALGKAGTGTYQLAVNLQVQEGEHKDKCIIWFGYLSENALPYTVEAMTALGWSGDDVTDLKGITANEVQIVVDSEEYEGRTRSKVQYVNKLGGGPIVKERLGADEERALAAKLKGRIAAMRAKSPAPASGAPVMDKAVF